MGDNNSPILLTDVPQPIATFNKPFELSELVGNLDGVMYLYSGEAVNVTCVSDVEEGETKYFLAYDNGEAHIGELSVEGSTLLCAEKGNENYLFDLDFKHQNRKFFELSNGTYAVALPRLGLDADSKVLVSISGESSGKTVTIHYVDNDYRAWGQAGGAIREISWFNQQLTSDNIANIVSLVDKLMKLEYSPEAAGGITVTSANTQPTTVAGDWNLFTDGTAYIPLRIVSRFPNGCPILAQTISKTASVCTFNREPKPLELEKLVIYTGIGEGMLKYASILGELVFFDGQSKEVAMRINGSTVSIDTTEGDAVDIYDIDFDHQFRRSLPAGLVKMNVQLPQLLVNPSTGQGFGIIHEAEIPENFGVFTAEDNSPYIVEDNTLSSVKGGWANSLSWSSVQSLLEAIIAMEFEGFNDNPPSVAGTKYREALATGFTIAPLIPQTLS